MRVVVAMVVLITACTSTTSTTNTSSSPGTTPGPVTSTSATTTIPIEPMEADVVLHSGTVITVDTDFTVATGVAIAGDRIVAVGDGATLLASAPDAVAVDLEGRTVIPGIVDPHIHLVQGPSPDFEAMMAEERALLESGRTTLGVPAIIPLNLEGYQNMLEGGGPILRSHLYLAVNDACGDTVETDGWWKEYEFDRSVEHRVAFAGIKVFADGGSCNVPAFSFDWVDGTMGSLYVDSAYIVDILRQADEEGALAIVHAIGDRAVDTVLTGFEEALGGDNPNRHRIDHNSLLHDDWVGRYGASGANFVGWAWFNSCPQEGDDGWESLTAEQLTWIRNHKAVMEASPEVAVSWHSDAPFTPTSIFEQLLGLTSFTSLDANGEPCPAPAWLEQHQISVDAALRMMTFNAAAVMDLETHLGSIEVGKIADLAVLANNPLDQSGLSLLDNQVVSTWVSGRPEFCDTWDACSALALTYSLLGIPEGLKVTASSSRDIHVPELVLDGVASDESFWSSGSDAPGWIQIDFEQPRTLAGLRFTVFQNPPSDTIHVLELHIEGVWTEVERFEGFTTTGDVLEWTPDEPVSGVEGLRMTTIESLSWPEWYEIEIAT